MNDYAWAIRCIYAEPNGTVTDYLAGRYYFSYTAPDCFDGYTTAVFRTRAKARSALAGLKRSWAIFGERFKPRIVRVKVGVSEWPG